MRGASQLLETLGRVWEAWGWQIALLNTQPTDAQALQERDRLRQRLDQEHPPLVLASANPAASLDLSTYSLPQFPQSLATVTPKLIGADGSPRAVRRPGEPRQAFRFGTSTAGWRPAGS